MPFGDGDLYKTCGVFKKNFTVEGLYLMDISTIKSKQAKLVKKRLQTLLNLWLDAIQLRKP